MKLINVNAEVLSGSKQHQLNYFLQRECQVVVDVLAWRSLLENILHEYKYDLSLCGSIALFWLLESDKTSKQGLIKNNCLPIPHYIETEHPCSYL